MKRFLLVLFGILVCFNALAEEIDQNIEEEPKKEVKEEQIELPPIVVSPTKYETPISTIPFSITVIGEDEIDLKQKFQVKDIIPEVPGVNVAQTSAFGGATSVFIRGTNSNHTLIMIDGVKVYNPISTNGAFNLANLTLDNVERIEILRGTHSTLYGSDAIGGVMDIITKKGEGKPKVWASLEGGSYVTFKEVVGSDGEMNGLYYSAAIARLDTKGISKADKKFDNDEKDSYHNTSISGRVDYDVFDNFTIGSTYRRTDADIKVDDSGGYGGDDPNRRTREINTILSAYADLNIFEWWKLNFKSLWMRNELYDKDKGDDFDPGEYLDSHYKGRYSSYQGLSILELTDFDTLLAGIDYYEEEGDSFYNSVDSIWGPWFTDSPRTKAHNVAYYLQNKADIGDNFHTIAGFRIDDHSEFGTHDTYEISGKYIFNWGTSVKGSWATGFKAPSLFQLYDPSNGNVNLKPEESETFEAGIGQNLWDDKIKMESTYFRTKLDNLIDWASTGFFTGAYQNVSKARIWGVENIVMVQPAKEIKINYSYTYLSTQNAGTKQALNRRPRNKHSLSIDIYPIENLTLNVLYLYVGGRKDVMTDANFAQHQINLKHYNKVDISSRYVINKNFELFARVENLLNQFYEEVDGYGMPGISFYGGGKVTF